MPVATGHVRGQLAVHRPVKIDPHAMGNRGDSDNYVGQFLLKVGSVMLAHSLCGLADLGMDQGHVGAKVVAILLGKRWFTGDVPHLGGEYVPPVLLVDFVACSACFIQVHKLIDFDDFHGLGVIAAVAGLFDDPFDGA